jgi:hypothetical protein
MVVFDKKLENLPSSNILILSQIKMNMNPAPAGKTQYQQGSAPSFYLSYYKGERPK